jgi:hypothetical protein
MNARNGQGWEDTGVLCGHQQKTSHEGQNNLCVGSAERTGEAIQASGVHKLQKRPYFSDCLIFPTSCKFLEDSRKSQEAWAEEPGEEMFQERWCSVGTDHIPKKPAEAGSGKRFHAHL